MTSPVPMPVDTLTRHRDRTSGEAGGVLAQGRRVGVVGGEHRQAPGQPGLQVLGHRVGVPARQDRAAGWAGRTRGRSGREG